MIGNYQRRGQPVGFKRAMDTAFKAACRSSNHRNTILPTPARLLDRIGQRPELPIPCVQQIHPAAAKPQFTIRRCVNLLLPDKCEKSTSTAPARLTAAALCPEPWLFRCCPRPSAHFWVEILVRTTLSPRDHGAALQLILECPSYVGTVLAGDSLRAFTPQFVMAVNALVHRVVRAIPVGVSSPSAVLALSTVIHIRQSPQCTGKNGISSSGPAPFMPQAGRFF